LRSCVRSGFWIIQPAPGVAPDQEQVEEHAQGVAENADLAVSVEIPLDGDLDDLVAMMGAVVVGFSLSQTSWDKGHVFVDFLIENRSKAVKNGFFITTRMVGMIIFALVSFNLVRKGISFYGSGETSMTLRVPMFPVVIALAFCFFVQCFSFITDIFRIFDTGETT